MKKATRTLLLLGSVALGAVAGYVVIARTGLGDELRDRFVKATEASRQKVEEMTEEVAIKTAKVTNNPKITQDWVARQWDNLGY